MNLTLQKYKLCTNLMNEICRTEGTYKLFANTIIFNNMAEQNSLKEHNNFVFCLSDLFTWTLIWHTFKTFY